MSSSGTIHSTYSPKTIATKPTESIQIDTGITSTLPDNIDAVLFYQHCKITDQRIIMTTN